MLYEPGVYAGRIEGAKLAVSKAGNPYLAVELMITHIQSGGKWEPIANGKRTLRIPLTEKAMPFSKPKLLEIGFQGDFDSPAFKKPDGSEMKSIRVVCKPDTYKGKPSEAWDVANPSEPVEAPTAAPGLARELNALYAGNDGTGPQHCEDIDPALTSDPDEPTCEIPF